MQDLSKLEYRILRQPYGTRGWLYAIQGFHKGKWKWIYHGWLSRSRWERDEFWTKQEALDWITAVKRGDEYEVISLVIDKDYSNALKQLDKEIPSLRRFKVV